MGWWLISKYCTRIQNGYQLIWKYFGQIPIPKKMDSAIAKNIEKIVEHILAKKKVGEDTVAEEAEIDRLVYALYGLTEEEKAVVEGRAYTESADRRDGAPEARIRSIRTNGRSNTRGID